MQSHPYPAEGLEPVSDLRFEPGRVTKTFLFRNGGKAPRGIAYLAVVLKGIRCAAEASVMLNRAPLGKAVLRAHRGGWRCQVVAFPGHRLRDGANELSIHGVETRGGLAEAPEPARLSVIVRLENDV